MRTQPLRRCFLFLGFSAFALAFAAWLPVAPASAQDKPQAQGGKELPPLEEQVDYSMKRMTGLLDLSEEQQKEIRPIVEDNLRARRELPLQWGKTWRKRAQLRRLLSQADDRMVTQVEKHLTDEQITKFRAHREERKAAWEERSQAGAAAKPKPKPKPQPDQATNQ